MTQEVDDIIHSPIVKESIINNSDCKILLDQRKYMNKFDDIQAMLGLTEKEKSQILSINMNNDPTRLYKEVWIGLGGMHSAVYATEVSFEEYMAYTTEEVEKLEVMTLAEEAGGSVEQALKRLALRKKEQEKINNYRLKYKRMKKANLCGAYACIMQHGTCFKSPVGGNGSN